MDTTNEPVAWITMSGLSYQQTGLQDRPLYTRPNEADLGIAEAIGFDKGYKAATAKTLTDEEIHDLIVNKVTDYDMIKQALRKAQGD
jgi:hypothetical protein